MSVRDEVLDKTDIVDLVSRYVDLKKVGKNRAGLCPFHKEKTPSFTVAEDKQIFKCFGCGKWGNAITFHMEIERIDFIDTLKILANDANIDMKEFAYDPDKAGEKQEKKEKFKLLNKRIQKFFSQHFPDSVAEQYVKEKRKLSDTTIDTFGIGYAPDSHYDAITALKEKWFTAEDMITAGLARKGSSGDTYSFFRHRLTFPIHDHIGNIVGFGARALDPDQNPKYLNTTETPLYDKSKILFGLNHARDHLKARDLLIVVEGYMDVIALHQYGLPIGIATCGTALTPQHAKLVSRHSENVLFAFDNDDAGFQATVRGLKVAYSQDLFPKVLQFPTEYKDVDERLTALSLSDRPPVKGVDSPVIDDALGESGGLMNKQRLMENAIDGFTYILRSLSASHDLLNPVERKQVLRTCFELLAPIEDRTILSLYLDQMSKPFGTWSDVLLQQFKGFLKKSRSSNFQPYEEEKDDGKIAAKFLLASLRYDDFLHNHFGKELTSSRLQEYISIVESLSSYFPTSLVFQSKQKELNDKDQQKMLEAQLRREHQFWELSDDKKTDMLIRFLGTQLHTMERVVLKSKKISDADKQEIMMKVKGLKR